MMIILDECFESPRGEEGTELYNHADGMKIGYNQ